MACAFQVNRQHLDVKGNPLDGALLYCYEYGGTLAKSTYVDPDLTTLNSNPIVLNDRGSCKVYWDGTPVRFELWYRNELVDSWDKVTADATVEVEAHINNLNNPHQVTAAQVNAYTKQESNTQINNYGLLMRSNGVNTLQFYRPTL